MTYPDGIDALVNVNATDTLAAGGHAARHNSTNTALAEVRNFLASGSANTVLTAGSPVPIWAPLAASGKILQVVRATDTTARFTNNDSFSDAGLSVTITPQKNDSAILLIVNNYQYTNNSDNAIRTQITDASNNAISGAEATRGGVGANFLHAQVTLLAWATPSTTSAVTYKLRFRSNISGQGVDLLNATNTGQMYAIEVAA
jgi:hypothetical protein